MVGHITPVGRHRKSACGILPVFGFWNYTQMARRATADRFAAQRDYVIDLMADASVLSELSRALINLDMALGFAQNGVARSCRYPLRLAGTVPSRVCALVISRVCLTRSRSYFPPQRRR